MALKNLKGAAQAAQLRQNHLLNIFIRMACVLMKKLKVENDFNR